MNSSFAFARWFLSVHGNQSDADKLTDAVWAQFLASDAAAVASNAAVNALIPQLVEKMPPKPRAKPGPKPGTKKPTRSDAQTSTETDGEVSVVSPVVVAPEAPIKEKKNKKIIKKMPTEPAVENANVADVSVAEVPAEVPLAEAPLVESSTEVQVEVPAEVLTDSPLAEVAAEVPLAVAPEAPIKEKKPKKSTKKSPATVSEVAMEVTVEEPVVVAPPAPIKEKKTKKSKKQVTVVESPLVEATVEEPVVVAPPAPIKEKKNNKSKKSPVNANKIDEPEMKSMECPIDIISPVGEIDALSAQNFDDALSLHSEAYEQTVLVEMFVNEVLFYQDPNTNQWFDTEYNQIEDPSI